MNNKHVKTSKETLKKCVSLANDAHGRTEEGASPCASGAGKRFNQRFPKEALPAGTILDDKYCLVRVLGTGGFGITYEAVNTRIGKKTAIKEFYYSRIMSRDAQSSGSVYLLNNEYEALFIREKENFLREARILSDFSMLEGIVRIIDYFESNNTAYIVMDYLEGETLEERRFNKNGKLSVYKLLTGLYPVMKSLEKIHRAGIIHGDISPDNIMILKDNTYCLYDFGAARQYLQMDPEEAVRLKNGYSPRELYQTGDYKEKTGPWSDVYSLCATIYACITGQIPQNALQRCINDELEKPSELGVAVDPNFERILMSGLELSVSDRLQSVSDIICDTELFENQSTDPLFSKKNGWIIAVSVFVTIIIVISGALFYRNHEADIKFRGRETTTVRLSPSGNMSVNDYYKAIDTVKDRFEIMVGEDGMIWREDRDNIYVTTLLDSYSDLSIEYVLDHYIFSPWGMGTYSLIGKDDVKERNFHYQGKDTGKEGTIEFGSLETFNEPEAFTNLKLQKGGFPGSDSDKTVYDELFGHDPESGYSYIELKSDGRSDADAGSFLYGRDESTDPFYNGDMKKYPADYLSVQPGPDPDTECLMLPGESDNLDRVILYSLSHPGLDLDLNYDFLPVINWEELGEPLLDGRYQINDQDMKNPLCVVCLADTLAPYRGLDPDTKKRMYRSELSLKNKLDGLGVPYVFGISPDKRQFFVKIGEDFRTDETELAIKHGERQFRVYLSDTDYYIFWPYYENDIERVLRVGKTESGGYELLFDPNEVYKGMGSDFWEDVRKNGQDYSEPIRISLLVNGLEIVYTDLDKVPEDGLIHFDKLTADSILTIDERGIALINLLINLADIEYLDDAQLSVSYSRFCDKDGNIEYENLGVTHDVSVG
ncbi:MAG: serine/threonine protein kinase [Lachnospiraceae bacterium]|nr:serine/threonine protein kinase [Lachnospiraceae bacterium]